MEWTLEKSAASNVGITDREPSSLVSPRGTADYFRFGYGVAKRMAKKLKRVEIA
jgi:hypothetical protein